MQGRFKHRPLRRKGNSVFTAFPFLFCTVGGCALQLFFRLGESFLKIITPSFYKKFKCIAGDCPDSCCQGWEVDADSDSLQFYKTFDGPLREKIDSVLDKDEYGNTVFRLAAGKRCPFLNSSNLCDMHIAIGGGHTPYTCRTFPRFINDFGATREMGLSFSCPVASDLMWNLEEDFDFDEELDSSPPVLNDIDAQLYFELRKQREFAYSLIKNKSLCMGERLFKLLDFAADLQNELGAYNENEAGPSILEVFDNPELINPEWKLKIQNAAFDKTALNTKSCENIVMYFLFRYFLESVYDRDVLSRAKLAVLGALIPAFFGNDAWTVHLWSKETEHSDTNMQRLRHQLRNNKYLSAENLKEYLI